MKPYFKTWFIIKSRVSEETFCYHCDKLIPYKGPAYLDIDHNVFICMDCADYLIENNTLTACIHD